MGFFALSKSARVLLVAILSDPDADPDPDSLKNNFKFFVQKKIMKFLFFLIFYSSFES